MAQTMIASEPMTDGQIENVVAKLRDALRKHRGEMTKEAAQLALGTENIGMLMFEPFRQCAEKFSEMIVRRVKVNRGRNPREMVAATNRAEYLNNEVVDAMPRCEGEEVDVCFFPLKKFTSVADFQKALQERGLEPDPYAVAAVNEADPAFADEHPNGTQWMDANGNHCYLSFTSLGGERHVFCGRLENDWSDGYWIGGVRKQS